MERLLKALALVVALAFLVGAVLTASRPADAAPPRRDAGADAAAPSAAPDASATGAELLVDDDVGYFSASKSGPLPRPRKTDGGAPERRYMPATKSPGAFAPTPQQQAR